MNSVDIAILVIMGLSCLMGIVRGLTKEVLSMVTWAGASLGAYYTYPLLSPMTRSYIANTVIADGISSAVLFIVYLIILSIFSFNISTAVRQSMVGAADRGLGLVFGVVRGSVFLCAVEILVSLFIPREAQSLAIQSAQFVPIVRRGADEFLSLLPAQLRQMLDEQSQRIRQEARTNEKIASQLLQPVYPIPTHNYQASEAGQQAPAQEEGIIVKRGRTGSSSPSSSLPKPPQKIDSQATADSLSELRPKAVKNENKTSAEYDRRIQRELDRLIETSD